MGDSVVVGGGGPPVICRIFKSVVNEPASPGAGPSCQSGTTLTLACNYILNFIKLLKVYVFL